NEAINPLENITPKYLHYLMNRSVRDPYAEWCERRTVGLWLTAVYSIVCLCSFPFVADCFGLPPCVGADILFGKFWLLRLAFERLGNVYGYSAKES
ncbi:MAG: hypothetical protein RIF33_07605, partial [Cyclobacteriaceae bacterium]